MIIKLTKTEVETAVEWWLRAKGYKEIDTHRQTNSNHPVAIDMSKDMMCHHTREGVTCEVFLK